ncbi:hypothetical protein NE626_16055, partial [Intestinimonas massiliensis]|nr:hypothetical protein [Intestinimonas massiliensis (ex Afouda et al. 2020)]
RAFAEQVAGAAGLTPVLWDERRTTIEAHAILHAGGKKILPSLLFAVFFQHITLVCDTGTFAL